MNEAVAVGQLSVRTRRWAVAHVSVRVKGEAGATSAAVYNLNEGRLSERRKRTDTAANGQQPSDPRDREKPLSMVISRIIHTDQAIRVRIGRLTPSLQRARVSQKAARLWVRQGFVLFFSGAQGVLEMHTLQ